MDINIAHKAFAFTAGALAITGMIPVAASATTTHETASPAPVVQEQAGSRDITPVEGVGLHLQMERGDTVTISGSTATWADSEGMPVATIDLTSNDASVGFTFDEATHDIVPRTAAADGPEARLCMSKWVNVGWNVLWDGLVCAPASAVITPVGGVACGAVGGAIGAAVSC